MIRLIAIDVDGTLLDGAGRLPAANRAAIAAAAARGVHVVVVTGRSYPFALLGVEPLADPLTLVVYNGAVARVRGGETIVRRTIPGALASRLLADTSAWRTSTLVQFDRDDDRQTLYDRMSWTLPNRQGYYSRIRHHTSRVDDLAQAMDADPVQVAFNGACEEMLGVQAALAAHPDRDRLSVSATHYPRRDFSLIDVNTAGATKGGGLAAVAAYYGVAREEVFAIGDNHNDVDMLQWAGTAVVMGNAEPELLAMGLPVTAGNDEAGLAAALEKYVL